MFGCGNRDWVQTYQRIPRLVDELLGERGGKALLPRGEGDAGGSDIFNHFDDWEDRLFKRLTEVTSPVRPASFATDTLAAQVYHTKSSTTIPSIEIQETAPGTERAATLRQADAALGEVISNTILTAPGKPVKRHLGEVLKIIRKSGLTFDLEFELPPDQTYSAGDYLAMWEIISSFNLLSVCSPAAR